MKITTKQLVKRGVITETPIKHVREVEKGHYTSLLAAIASPSTTVTETDYEIELTDEAERLLQPLLRKVDAGGLSEALNRLLGSTNA